MSLSLFMFYSCSITGLHRKGSAEHYPQVGYGTNGHGPDGTWGSAHDVQPDGWGEE